MRLPQDGQMFFIGNRFQKIKSGEFIVYHNREIQISPVPWKQSADNALLFIYSIKEACRPYLLHLEQVWPCGPLILCIVIHVVIHIVTHIEVLYRLISRQ